MSVFVLVHGAFHGRWCFRRLISSLEAKGHQAIAIDLPGNGHDDRDPATVTMDDYLAAIGEAVDSVEHEKPILVGHSMGGAPVSLYAEQNADKIAALTYVTAYVPKSGECVMAIDARVAESPIRETITPAPDLSVAMIDAERASPIFYNGCDTSDARFATDRLTTQPGAPFLTPVFLTENGFGSVSKKYFMCEQDRVIPLSLQQEMTSARHDIEVVRLDSGHSPFFSHVEELTNGLVDYAEKLSTQGAGVAA